jgi:PrcB C-terminal
MKSVDRFCAILAGALIASSVAPATQTALPRTIAKGDQSNIESPEQVLARTEAEWGALWRRHAGEGDRPRVDFTREMVVGVFMGSRPHGGFSTLIVTSMEVKGILVVRYRETIPPRDAITAQVLTTPYHLVAIPKAAVTDVKFEKVP